MRLIDADALICGVTNVMPCNDLNVDCGFCQFYDKEERFCLLEDWVYNAPTIDAAEVVRCKNCRYWKNFNNVQGICNERQNIITTEQYNDFCSHAERRKEEFVPLQEVELTEEAKAKMKGGDTE